MFKEFKHILIAFAALWWIVAPGSAAAAPDSLTIPDVIYYGARISDSEGRPLNDEVSVKVFIYDSATEGQSGDLDDERLVYAEDYGDIQVVRGRMSLAIGSGEPLGTFAGSALPMRKLAEAASLYLELEVEGELIAPRQKIAFSKSAHAVAYARSAKDLDGDYTISASSFSSGIPAAKIDCSGSRPDIDSNRISYVPVAKISGILPHSTMPSGIPLSKIDPAGGALDVQRLPNVPATSVQSGTFAAGVLPDSILSPAQIRIAGSSGTDHVSGNATAISGSTCHCMAALRTTTGGGAEGMNTVDVEMDPNGGTVSCTMSFEEGGVWSRIDTAECEQYPLMDGSNDKVALCNDYCSNLCCTMPGCLGDGEQQCMLGCTMPCQFCYQSGNVTLPCNTSYLCMCID